MLPVDDNVSAVTSAPNPLATALAAMPEVWQSLLLEHQPDSYGRCRSCRKFGTPGVPWPCTLRVAAEDAREIAHRESPPSAQSSAPPSAPWQVTN